MDDVKVVVPARNDFKKAPVFVRASIADQAGHKPGYVRQWMSKDPQHPLYFGKYLDTRRVGSPDIGYCDAEPWTVVPRKDAKPGRKRDDDTSGIESAQTHGDLVLMETTEENAAVDREFDRLRRQAAAAASRGVQVENMQGAQIRTLTAAGLSAGDAIKQVQGA